MSSDLSLIEIGRLGKCRGFQGDIHRVGEHNGVMTVAFDRLDSKEDVEVHKNTTVSIEESYVTIEQSEALIFMDYEVYDQDENHIGRVVDVIDQSPLLLLQVEDHGKDKIYTLPFHEDLLIREDVEGKKLTIEIVEGLLNI